MNTTIIFFLITLVNVVLSTVKSIVTVRAKRKSSAAIMNAIAYGFYAMVVKQMATVSTEIVVISTVLCNLVGVYFSMWLIDLLSEDTMWKISVVPHASDLQTIKRELEERGMGYNQYEMTTQYGKTQCLDIFAKTSEKSKEVKEILNRANKVKYHVVELGKTL